MKKHSILILLSLLFTFSACETVDFGDINENPNGSLEFNSAALLTAAQRRFVTIGFRNWLANPHHYVQYQGQPVYPDPSRYAETPVDWSPYYSQTLMNLEQILRLSEDPEVTGSPAYLANGSINNQVAVAKIMKVIIFKHLTDTYGDIPYFDALNSETLSPAYTPQREIYQDFIVELKAARDLLNSAEDGATGDLFYNGNPDSWKKLANSLLLAVTMQVSETDLAGEAATEFAAALNHEAGVIETSAEEAWYQPLNVSTLVNPWTAFRPADYNMAEFFQGALQGVEEDYSNDTFDARLNVYSTNPEAPGLEYGLQEGEAAGTPARISLYLTSPTTPFPIFTASYTYLNRAEAAELGWTSEVAAEMLTAGIEASYASISDHFGNGPHIGDAGLTPIDITGEAAAFAAARVADAASVGMLQVIGEEKWAALFPQGFLAWNEWRRTGFPNISPSPDPLNDGGIPTRYLYPVNEQNLNNANYQTGVQALSPAADKNTSKVWWDQ